MVDWTAYVKRRLDAEGLSADIREEVVEELAAHCEDKFESLCARGIREAEAMCLTVAEVKNWQELCAEIAAARGEAGMEDRVKQVWIPGMITLCGAAGVLTILVVSGARPVAVHPGDANPIELFVPWLASLAGLGALGAFLARRAEAKGVAAHLASLFPALVMVAAVGATVLAALVFDRRILPVFETRMCWISAVNGVVLPGSALLLGDLMFHWLYRKRVGAA